MSSQLLQPQCHYDLVSVAGHSPPPDLCLPHAENYHHEHRPLVYSYRFKGYDYELGLELGY